MRLVDLDPSWAVVAADGRHGMGITFLCPRCQKQYLGVWFKNPVDGGTPAAADIEPIARWARTGETFETLSLSPSVDASKGDPSCTPGPDGAPRGHWHGYITAGEMVGDL